MRKTFWGSEGCPPENNSLQAYVPETLNAVFTVHFLWGRSRAAAVVLRRRERRGLFHHAERDEYYGGVW